jgi:hypothetical protein
MTDKEIILQQEREISSMEKLIIRLLSEKDEKPLSSDAIKDLREQNTRLIQERNELDVCLQKSQTTITICRKRNDVLEKVCANFVTMV